MPAMRIVHVDVHVDPDNVEGFLTATSHNAEASRAEPGVLRFDVVQDRSDPTHIVLVEVYADEEAPAAHKATPHYGIWRDTVAPWMARPRTSITFDAVDPAGDPGWRSSS